MDFIDLKKQQTKIKEKITKNINKVLNHGKYILGPEVNEIEEKLSDYINIKYALGVSSGTDALLMSLMAYDVKENDAVFVTSFSFIASAEVICLLKATPIFIDIDEDTFNINPKKLKDEIIRIKNNTNLNPKAVIAVDIFGQSADYNEINKIAKQFDLKVIEDAAQSLGGTYFNKKNCSHCDIAVTSFFPSKPLGCYGDGGMIFTKNSDIYQKLVSIRVHGKGKNKYDNIRIGLNGRLDTIQAAILLAKFDIFEEEIQLRQNIANNYNVSLKKIVKIPHIEESVKSAWAQYSIISEKRDRIMNELKKNSIPSMIYYPTPLPLLKTFKNLKYKRGDFKSAENICNKILSLPIHPYLEKNEQYKITEIITNAVI